MDNEQGNDGNKDIFFFQLKSEMVFVNTAIDMEMTDRERCGLTNEEALEMSTIVADIHNKAIDKKEAPNVGKILVKLYERFGGKVLLLLAFSGLGGIIMDVMKKQLMRGMLSEGNPLDMLKKLMDVNLPEGGKQSE